MEWFWEALTQKRENDSYYYCYLLRRTNHGPDLLLIFGNFKHLCCDPKRVCGFEPSSFNIKAKSQLWELAYNILRRFIPITFILDKCFNILSASLLCLWNRMVNKSWNLALSVLWHGYCWSLNVRGHSFESQSSFDGENLITEKSNMFSCNLFCLFNLGFFFSQKNPAVNNQNLR